MDKTSMTTSPSEEPGTKKFTPDQKELTVHFLMALFYLCCPVEVANEILKQVIHLGKYDPESFMESMIALTQGGTPDDGQS